MTDKTNIQELRVSVLAAVLEACREHGLPAPMNVGVTEYGLVHIQLRFDEDQPGHVDAWVDHLGLPAADDTLFEDSSSEQWVSHRARFADYEGRAWLGADMVTAWCSVRDKSAIAAAVARAALEA